MGQYRGTEKGQYIEVHEASSTERYRKGGNATGIGKVNPLFDLCYIPLFPFLYPSVLPPFCTSLYCPLYVLLPTVQFIVPLVRPFSSTPLCYHT